MRACRRIHWPAVAAALLAAALTPSVRAQEEGPPTREEHERLEREIEELRRELSDARFEPVALGERRAVEDEAEEEETPRLPGYKGGLYDKPFIGAVMSRAYLGGYFDIEYRDPENGKHDIRFHRFIPFIYADFHERLRFASELEIEDGSEVEMEFAYLDFLLRDEVNVRGGVILDPLGKFNLIHDSPINDLTDRPLVNQFVIPTTLREVGLGLFGTLTPAASEWEVKYEAYVVSGFKGLDNTGTSEITSASGLRDARPSKDVLGTRHFGDVNNKFAGVGRLSVSPSIGSEFGVSAHHGAYDEAGDNDLTIAAIDGLYTIPEFQVGDVPVGPIELLGEGAFAFVERDDFAGASGVAGDMWGYYLQANYHFMPEWLRENASLIFLPGSTFTLVGRWDQVDLDGNRQRRFTIGLNYRPIESTAFKIDYQFNRGTGSAPDSADDDAFVASITSYF